MRCLSSGELMKTKSMYQAFVVSYYGPFCLVASLYLPCEKKLDKILHPCVCLNKFKSAVYNLE